MKKLFLVVCLVGWLVSSFVPASYGQEVILSEKAVVWEFVIWKLDDNELPVEVPEFIDTGKYLVSVSEDKSNNGLIFTIDKDRHYFISNESFNKVMSAYNCKEDYYESPLYTIGGIETKFGLDDNSILIMNNNFICSIELSEDELKKLFSIHLHPSVEEN